MIWRRRTESQDRTNHIIHISISDRYLMHSIVECKYPRCGMQLSFVELSFAHQRSWFERISGELRSGRYNMPSVPRHSTPVAKMRCVPLRILLCVTITIGYWIGIIYCGRYLYVEKYHGTDPFEMMKTAVLEKHKELAQRVAERP